MSTVREFEMGIAFGNTYWKVLKFKMYEMSKDCYFIFPIPDIGLKFSFHTPRPPYHPNSHVHIKSDKLDIHEDIDATFFSPDFLRNTAMEWIESWNFGYCQPSSDEDVMVIKTNSINNFVKHEVQGKKEKMVLNMGSAMEMLNGTFYSTKAKRLPLLLRRISKDDPALDLRRDLSIICLSQDRIIIPISTDEIIEFEYRKLLEKMNNTGFKLLTNPMQRAFEEVSKLKPNALQQWFPSVGIENHINRVFGSLNQGKPRIIYF